MRKLILSLMAAAALAGCATQPGETGPQIDTRTAATSAGVGVGTLLVIGFVGATVLAAAASDAINKN